MLRKCLHGMMRSALVALFVFVAIGFRPALAGEIFQREPLTITRSSGETAVLNVELALTPGQREQGLMFRRAMGENEGMLFDFGESRMVFMWMKNTDLPLDMIFLDAGGRIVHLHENAVPYSEAIIPSVEPVRFVLEVSAGTIKRLHIGKDDLVSSVQIAKAH